jgi:hypothetical protein
MVFALVSVERGASAGKPASPEALVTRSIGPRVAKTGQIRLNLISDLTGRHSHCRVESQNEISLIFVRDGIMIQAFVITLREGLEAFLIVAISLAYLKKTGRTSLIPAVHWGIGISGCCWPRPIIRRFGKAFWR